jgi:hypothetical protein
MAQCLELMNFRHLFGLLLIKLIKFRIIIIAFIEFSP